MGSCRQGPVQTRQWCRRGKLQHVASAASAEAQACVAALHQAAAWGMTRIGIESDAKNLVREVQSTTLDLAFLILLESVIKWPML
jgi:ribonuclease HI